MSWPMRGRSDLNSEKRLLSQTLGMFCEEHMAGSALLCLEHPRHAREEDEASKIGWGWTERISCPRRTSLHYMQ